MPRMVPLADIGTADPMSLQEHKAYLDATGGAINPSPVQSQGINRGGQEVTPIPKNIQGLADLLFRTGRARTPQDALIMAQYMLNRQ